MASHSQFEQVAVGTTFSNSPSCLAMLRDMLLSDEEQGYVDDAPTAWAGLAAVYIARKLRTPLTNLRFRPAVFTACGVSNTLVWQPVVMRVDAGDEKVDDGPALMFSDKFLVHVVRCERRWVLANAFPDGLYAYPAVVKSANYLPMTYRTVEQVVVTKPPWKLLVFNLLVALMAFWAIGRGRCPTPV